MTMQKQAFEDASPIKKCVFPSCSIVMLVFGGVLHHLSPASNFMNFLGSVWEDSQDDVTRHRYIVHPKECQAKEQHIEDLLRSLLNN